MKYLLLTCHDDGPGIDAFESEKDKETLTKELNSLTSELMDYEKFTFYGHNNYFSSRYVYRIYTLEEFWQRKLPKKYG